MVYQSLLINSTYRWTTHGILFYTTYISVDLAYHKIFCAKVGKGGIMITNAVMNFLK